MRQPIHSISRFSWSLMFLLLSQYSFYQHTKISKQDLLLLEHVGSAVHTHTSRVLQQRPHAVVHTCTSCVLRRRPQHCSTHTHFMCSPTEAVAPLPLSCTCCHCSASALWGPHTLGSLLGVCWVWECGCQCVELHKYRDLLFF